MFLCACLKDPQKSKCYDLPISICDSPNRSFQPISACFCPLRKVCLLLIQKTQNRIFTKSVLILPVYWITKLCMAQNFSLDSHNSDIFFLNNEIYDDHKGVSSARRKEHTEKWCVAQPFKHSKCIFIYQCFISR